MRLIDAYALKRKSVPLLFPTRMEPCGHIPVPVNAVVVAEIEQAPTIDAVPVVRCLECKHYKTGVCLKIYYDGLASRYAWQERNPCDFCSYGEKRRDKDGTT